VAGVFGTVIAVKELHHSRLVVMPIAILPDWTLPSVSFELWRESPQFFFERERENLAEKRDDGFQIQMLVAKRCRMAKKKSKGDLRDGTDDH
jgi:hypothetical protein